jgi:hypothetical protein
MKWPFLQRAPSVNLVYLSIPGGMESLGEPMLRSGGPHTISRTLLFPGGPINMGYDAISSEWTWRERAHFDTLLKLMTAGTGSLSAFWVSLPPDEF